MSVSASWTVCVCLCVSLYLCLWFLSLVFMYVSGHWCWTAPTNSSSCPVLPHAADAAWPPANRMREQSAHHRRNWRYDALQRLRGFRTELMLGTGSKGCWLLKKQKNPKIVEKTWWQRAGGQALTFSQREAAGNG